MPLNENYSLVLCSGGIDSTACIHFYKNLGFNIEALFVDYGQAALKQELLATHSVSEHYNIKLTTITISNNLKYQNGLIMGRNAFLYYLALMNFNKSNGIISSGIHAGTNYYDCSFGFLNKMQEIFDGYTAGAVKVAAPFITFSKKDIVEYCYLQNIPLQLTYSCEAGGDIPCGICNTCKDLDTIYASTKQ